MSAFMQSVDHINLLTTQLLVNRVVGYAPRADAVTLCDQWRVTHDNTTQTGRLLIRENLLSVSHRYEDLTEGELGPRLDAYTFARVNVPVPVIAVVKACHGYAYQSCEHPGWGTSMAKALIDTLEHRLIASLPGYSDADSWCWHHP